MTGEGGTGGSGRGAAAWVRLVRAGRRWSFPGRVGGERRIRLAEPFGEVHEALSRMEEFVFRR